MSAIKTDILIETLQSATPETPEAVSTDESALVYDPYNERIKLYGVGVRETNEIITHAPVDDLAGKITVYSTPGEDSAWERGGFQKEAVIKGFFPDEDAHIWATFTESEREVAPRDELHDLTVEMAAAKPVSPVPELPEGYLCHVSRPGDTAEICRLLDQTFEDYPTPIEEALIEEQIRTQANHFRVIRDPKREVVAVASAEIDHERFAAEMTDCATRPDQRGKGLMNHLLARLEHDLLRVFGIRDLYTLARADEVGMNCAFSKRGYDYFGRLRNNCRMPNGWESMNVWCKTAQPYSAARP